MNNEKITEKEEQQITVLEPQSVQPQPKGGLVQSAREFFGNAFGGGKTGDLNTLVENFTNEMTLVAEGLSQDQEQLRQRTDALEAHWAETEERVHARMKEVNQQYAETGKSLQQLSVRMQKLEERAERIEARLEKAEKKHQSDLAELEKKREASKKSPLTERWSGILKQITWIAAIIAGAWVITSIVGKF